MTPPSYRFDPILRGDTATMGLVLKQDDPFGFEEPSFVDLTDAVVRFDVTKPGGATLALSTLPGGGLTMTPRISLVEWVLPGAETAALPLGDIAGRVRATYADGTVETVLDFILPVQD